MESHLLYHFGVASTDEDIRLNRFAEQVLACCGPGKFLCLLEEADSLTAILRTKGVLAASQKISSVADLDHWLLQQESSLDVSASAEEQLFDSVIVDFPCVIAHIEKIDVLIARLGRFVNKNIVARCRMCDDRSIMIGRREWWIERFYAGGFQRHPLSFSMISYEALSSEYSTSILAFEKRSELVTDSKSSVMLRGRTKTPRDLLSGNCEESEGFMAVIDLVRNYIAPGDEVVLSGEQFGGGYMIRSGTLAGRIVEIYETFEEIEYAEQQYSAGSIVRLGAAEFWSGNTVELFDFAVICNLYKPADITKQFSYVLSRKLKPAGRAVLVIFNSDRDNIQGHACNDFISSLGAEFKGDLCWALSWDKKKEGFTDRALKALDPSEWANPVNCQILVVMVMQIPRMQWGDSSVLPDSKGYVNPWIIRSMISSGNRLFNAGQLEEHARLVLAGARPVSVEQGAALCVLSYRLLDRLKKGEQVSECMDQLIVKNRYFINDAVSIRSLLRWKISIAYVSALIMQQIGSVNDAKAFFRLCVSFDPLEVNPMIGSKTVSSFVHLGLLELSEAQVDNAKLNFARGLQVAMASIGKDWDQVIGPIEKPNSFGMPEIAQVARLAAKCANALNVLSVPEVSSGYYWKVIHSGFWRDSEQVELAYREIAQWADSIQKWTDAFRNKQRT